jgi:AraC-like DNA-binding protein
MPDFDYKNFISLFIVLISWILVFFLLTAKSKNKKSNLILVLFFLVNAQDSSGLFAFYFVYPKFPGLGMLINSTVFLKLPLLYLYIISVIYSDFKFQKKHLWHITPFLVDILLFVPRFYLVDFESKNEFLKHAKNDVLEIQISYILIHVQIGVYLFLSFKQINRYKKLLLENFSNANLFNYKWLFQFVLLFGIESAIASLKNLFLFLELELAFNITYYITAIAALIFMCWIVIKALQNPELFRGIKSDLRLVKNIVIENVQFGNSNISKQNDIEEVIALKKHMLENKPYLNANLTVEELATQMGIPSKELSILINHNLNQHFFDFINGYRIREAMGILKDTTRKEFTVLEILYEVGFNSKSSFNTAFKKYTNLTPTQYRKETIKE